MGMGILQSNANVPGCMEGMSGSEPISGQFMPSAVALRASLHICSVGLGQFVPHCQPVYH